MFYSLEDIIADICHFENVKMVLGEIRVQFLKLYSEVHKTPLSGDQKVRDFEWKVRAFVQEYGIPLTDKEPYEEFVYTVYGGCSYEEPMKRQTGFDDYEEFDEHEGAIRRQFTKMLIVDSVNRKFHLYDRKLES